MGAAIWSSSAKGMFDFPAETFVRFFENHRLFHLDKPSWRTVVGGSREYVKRLTAPFRDKLRLATPVTAVHRTAGGVAITDQTGRTEHFDHTVLACHSDQALGLLADATEAERQTLGALRYAANTVCLHRDPTLMPKRNSVWSSWNYLARPSDDGGAVSVTYWMNAMQSIDNRCPLFVSLNPPRPPAPHLTFQTFACDHPQFDADALVAQHRLHLLQGVRNTWFCGAYTGYGFHEDGLTSGLEVAQRLGAGVPWGRLAAPGIVGDAKVAAE